MKPIAITITALIILMMMTMLLPIYSTYERIDLDLSWEMDLVHKAQQHEISGRDFFFTYGPGAQMLYSISGLFRPSASIIDLAPLTYFILRLMVVVSLVACVLAIPRLDWRTSVIVIAVFGLLISWPIYFRALLATLAVLMLGRALSMPHGRSRDLWCLASGIVCFLGQIITFEVGIFSTASCIGTLALCWLLWIMRHRMPSMTLLPPREIGRAFVFVLSAFIGANLLLILIFRLSSSTYHLFDYHYYNFQLARAYNYTMGAEWDIDALMMGVLIAIAFYCTVVLTQRFTSLPVERRYVVLALVVLTILHFKGAVVRSGGIKILMSITPLIMLFLLLAFDTPTRRRMTLSGLLLLMLLITAWPFQSGVQALRILATIPRTPSVLIDRITAITTHHVAPSDVVPNEISQALRPDSYLLNFPYENLMAVALNRPNITPVLQPYSAHNLTLQQFYIDRMAELRDHTEIIYSLDAITSNELDVLQNVTRSPLIFEYIFSNFELKLDRLFKGGYFILQPRTMPSELPVTPLPFTITEIDGIQVAMLQNPAACTLLKLHVYMDYPPTALLGRPTPVTLRALAGQRELISRRMVPIEVGQEFSTYLYLGDPRTFYRVFTPGQPNAFNEAVDRVELGPVSFGLFDVNPSRVQLSGIDCVNLSPGTVVIGQPDRDSTVGPIVGDAAIRQEFVAEQANLIGVYVDLATFGRRNEGPITFQLQRLDTSGVAITLAETRVEMAELEDNSRFLFRFAPQSPAGQRYALVVNAPTGTPTNAITLWMQSGDPYPSGQLFHGKQPMQGDIAFQLLYQRP